MSGAHNIFPSFIHFKMCIYCFLSLSKASHLGDAQIYYSFVTPEFNNNKFIRITSTTI
jgi:hypothetical protein